MPRMAPLWWESLYLMFIMLFFITSIIIYHMPKLFKMKVKSMEKMTYQMTCKW